MTETLKEPVAYQAGRSILQTLEHKGFRARFVGGCVRDRLLGLKPKDYDIATDALPEQVIAVFRGEALKVVPVGLQHGTVTIVTKQGAFEVTTLRRDVSTDGRRAEVAFTDDFQVDAARRDFTVNAMFEDGSGNVIDYFDGQQHLREKKLLFVGDPITRIQEDYLRIMRFFRFKARFGFASTPATFAAISQECAGLSKVSQERITSELLAILLGPLVGPTLVEMHETGVLPLVIPHLNLQGPADPRLHLQGKLDALAAEYRAQARLALLWVKDHSFSVTPHLKPLRLSRVMEKQIATALERWLSWNQLGTTRADILLWIDQLEANAGVGSFKNFYRPLWDICLSIFFTGDHEHARGFARCVEVETSYGGLRTATLPISGKDIKSTLQLEEGPILGQLKTDLRRAFLNGLWSTKNEGLKWLRTHHKNSHHA